MANVGHLRSIGCIGEAMKERGHTVTVVTMDHPKGIEMCPKLFDPAGIAYKCTKADYSEKTEPFEDYLNCWQESALEAIKEINPDLIVCDALSSSIGAEKLGIPFVINVSTPLAVLLELGWIKAVDSNEVKNCCGCLCAFQSCLQCLYGVHVGLKPELKIMKGLRNTQNSHLVICNTFWGLEQPQALPPNFVVSGPLYTAQENLIPQLIEKDKELYDWLQKTLDDKQDVIYISIGTEVQWQQWSIDAVYAGVKAVGCKAVWSCKPGEG